MSIPAEQTVSDYVAVLRHAGHLLVPAAAMRAWLASVGSLADWPAFVASWDRMPEDVYMADGGHYRRRRHAIFSLMADGNAERQPHQAHYQSRDYNPLNGGVQRWFEPIEAEVATGTSLTTILRLCALGFGALQPMVPRWRCEVHQFRVEAGLHRPGQPTPEGMHHDGVDYVLVLLAQRINVDSGVTSIRAPDGRDLGVFTLTDPCDACLLDDARVLHGVTPVEIRNPGKPGYRDVLVVTLRRER